MGGPALLSGGSAPALHRHALRPVVTGLPLRARPPSPSLPPPRRLCFGRRRLAGEKTCSEGEINPFAPDSVPSLALPPVPSGGGG